MNKEEKYSTLRVVIFGAQNRKTERQWRSKTEEKRQKDRKTGKSFEEVLEKVFSSSKKFMSFALNLGFVLYQCLD